MRIGILPFNSSSIALVFFFIDLKKKKGKMPILAAKSCPCKRSFRNTLLMAVAKGKLARPKPFLEMLWPPWQWRNYWLKSKGASFTVYLQHFFINFGGENRIFTQNFMLFFQPDSGKNQTKESLHRKSNVFIRVIFIFRRRLFPFLRFVFLTEICCTWGPITQGASVEQEKKKNKSKK